MSKPGGTIYAIGAQGTSLIKIGSTRLSVATRLQTLQTGQPFPLHLLATVPVAANVRRIEQQVHRFLAQERRRGEWFDIALDAAALEHLVVRAVQCMQQEDESRRGEEQRKELAQDAHSTLGERVHLLRRRLGWTQRELGEAAGINTNTIARIERSDVKDPGGQMVARLARALRTTTDYLLGLSEESSVNSELLPTGEVLVVA